jgi:hypothetical protein
MTNIFIGILSVLTVSVIGCTMRSKNQQKTNTFQTIVIDKQKGWGGDFKLHIQNKLTKDSSYIYRICSIDKGLPVGFELQVPMKINKFGYGVVFKSSGDTSDNFIKTLYEIYGLRLQGSLKFVKSISCNYSGLNDIPVKGDGQKRLKSINYIKVFFEGTGENEYAELYLNIDEANAILELEEKDFDYRPYIAMFLTAE